MTFLKQAARRARPRATDLPRERYETPMRCTGCSVLVAVFQATHGAQSDADHLWLTADSYTCGQCIEAGA